MALRFSKKIWLVILQVLTLSISAQVCAKTQHAQTTRCFLPGIEDAAHCLTLAVPLDWHALKGKNISIFAAVFPALSRGSHQDPLFILPGGPGQSADMLLPMIKSAFSSVNKTRDLVLIYPRGTARSTPLLCLQPSALLVNDTAAVVKLFKACAASQKNNPRYFTTTEITLDINAIRESLGYNTINLWGGSYGTRLAQHYIAAYPEKVRTVILDGATRRSQSIFATIPHIMDVAINAVAIACKLDKACAAKGPDIRSDLHNLLLKVHNKPEVVTADNPLTGVPRTIIINENVIINVIGMALYNPDSRAIVPVIIRMASHANYLPLMAIAAQVSTQLGEDALSDGHQLSVLCAEDFQYTTRSSVAVAAQNTLSGMTEFDRTAALCSAWPHGIVPKSVWQTIQSNVPALILSGGLDPVTPPPLGAATAAQFYHATHIVAPASGHGVSMFGCAPKIITAFLEQASMHGIDTSCLTRPKPQAPLASRNG